MKDAAINIRISKDKKDAIETKTKELNISISKYILNAIDEKLNEDKKSTIPYESELARSIVKFSTLVNNYDSGYKEDMARTINDIARNLIDLKRR